ncbi:MAG: glycerophosphodiester phosphodiesterase [Blastocatellia bacterium]|nr:glycerophosphodiester phosphodiesterase [Blastocatellia bacterium]
MSPLVIAHRGASVVEPENTLRAFDLAIKQGAQMIELDLQLTRDNHVVVIHDAVLDHTTDLKGRIDHLSLSEVRKADAGKGERIPTLEETLDLTRRKASLYLEIKDPRAAVETLRLVRANRRQAEVMLASFDIDLMRRLGREVTDIELGVIMGTMSINPLVRWREAAPWIALRSINYQVLSLRVGLCFKHLAHQVKEHGKKLFVWTADDEKQYGRMIARRVDGIVTNVPDRLISYINRTA